MISELGQNLSIVIMTKTDLDWQTFATWYSFSKNLPEASICVIIERNENVPFVYYQWIKRLKIPSLRINPFTKDCEYVNWLQAINLCNQKDMLKESLLIIKPLTMALNSFDAKTLKELNETDLRLEEEIWILKNKNMSNLINSYYLENNQIKKSENKICINAKENNISNIISYSKGCGKWIHTAKGCPFSNAAGLVSEDMTINEMKIIDLWKKMVPLYNAIA